MKIAIKIAFLVIILAGCSPTDPETRLYQQIKRSSNKEFTIYNYPSIGLTSQEQQVRDRKQLESIKNEIKIGMDDTELVELWGKPNDIKKSIYPTGRFDTLIYESTGGMYMPIEHYYFIFRDHKLESWHKM